MKWLLSLIFASMILSCAHAVDATADGKNMTMELRKIKTVSPKTMKKTMMMEDQAVNLLKKQKDAGVKKRLLGEILRIYGEILEVDENYYVVEFFYDYYSKNKKDVEKVLKSSLNEKKQKIFREHIKTYKRVLEEGNG